MINNEINYNKIKINSFVIFTVAITYLILLCVTCVLLVKSNSYTRYQLFLKSSGIVLNISLLIFIIYNSYIVVKKDKYISNNGRMSSVVALIFGFLNLIEILTATTILLIHKSWTTWDLFNNTLVFLLTNILIIFSLLNIIILNNYKKNKI